MRSLRILPLLLIAMLALPATVWGQASASQRKAAAEAYDRGTADYLGGEYARAAQWFETAHRMAPAAPALMQAVRAHLKGENLAQASSLALRLRNEYPDVGQAVTYANQTLSELEGKFVRVDVICEECRIDLDGKIQESSSFFLEPRGTHTVTASFPTGDVAQEVMGEPGDTRELVFEAPPPSEDDPVAPTTDPQTRTGGTIGVTDPVEDVTGGDGLPPLYTYIGAGVTGALLVGTVITYLSLSGKNDDYIKATEELDACEESDCTSLFDAANKKQDDALSAETLNNVMMISTIAVGLGTGAIALFLTDWDGSDDDADSDSMARLTFDVQPVQDGALATLRGRFE